MISDFKGITITGLCVNAIFALVNNEDFNWTLGFKGCCLYCFIAVVDDDDLLVISLGFFYKKL